jgi:hypothetical protein
VGTTDPNPNFDRSGADDRHRPPVVWLLTQLEQPELIAR